VPLLASLSIANTKAEAELLPLLPLPLLDMLDGEPVVQVEPLKLNPSSLLQLYLPQFVNPNAAVAASNT
jgi:hypothetical protein